MAQRCDLTDLILLFCKQKLFREIVVMIINK